MAGTFQLLILTALVSVTLGCTQNNVDGCFLPLDTYLEAIHANRTVFAKGFGWSYLTDQELDGFCRIWTASVTGCLRSIRGDCSTDLQMEFVGLEDGYDFMCGSLDRFKAFKSCLNTEEVHRELSNCNVRLDRDIQLALQNEDEQHIQHGICNAVETAINCDYSAVRTQCGTDAAQWTEEFQNLINTPYMDKVHGCSDAGMCTQQNEERCWKPVNGYLISQQQYPIGYGEFDYRNLTSQQLTQFCSLYDSSTSSCLGVLKDSCSDFERKRFEGDEMSLDWLCKSGFTVYLKHRECLIKDELYTSEVQCVHQFNEDFDLVYDQTTAAGRDKAYCAAIEGLIMCKKEAVVSHCGQEAGEWMQEYDRAWLSPYLDGNTCGDVVNLHCADENLDICWQPADNYLADLNLDRKGLGLALSKLTDDQVRKYCKTYNNLVHDCLNKVKPYCDRATRTLLHTEMDTLTFMCGSDLETNLQHRTCLTGTNIQDELATCDTAFHKLEQESTTSSSTHEEQDLYCEALSAYVHCDQKAVDDYCDGEGADWSKAYLDYLRQSLYESYCNSTEDWRPDQRPAWTSPTAGPITPSTELETAPISKLYTESQTGEDWRPDQRPAWTSPTAGPITPSTELETAPISKLYTESQTGGLSGGAKAMIAIFTLLGIALLVTLAIVGYSFYKKRKTIRDQSQHVRFENPLATDGGPAATTQASAYIQNNNATSPSSEVKTAPPADNQYSNADLEAYGAEPKGAFPKPPEYSESSYEPTGPQQYPPPANDYARMEDVKPSVTETDITTTATSNPLYDNSTINESTY